MGRCTPVHTQRFVAGGDSFTVAGAPLARHAALADAGFAFAVARNATVSASYHGLFGGGAKDQGARLGLAGLKNRHCQPIDDKCDFGHTFRLTVRRRPPRLPARL